MWQLVLKRLMEFIGGLISARPAGQPAPSTTPSTPSPSPASEDQKKVGSMEIELVRKWKTERSTFGEIFVDGVFECFSLEDRDRLAEGLAKVFGQTAIPAGRYEIRRTLSPRFGRFLPEIMNVPNFEGVRFHPGNKPEDTDGCVLPGKIRGPDQVAESRQAFAELDAKIETALSLPIRVFLTVRSV